MDILLSTPMNETHYCVPPLGLGYLASALRGAGIPSVAILDPVKERMDEGSFAAFLEKHRPRVLGIQCYSFDVRSVGRMLDMAKRIDPNIRTVIGGPHPTAVCGPVLDQFRGLDFAIQGEGERSFPALVKALLAKDGRYNEIKGLIFRDAGMIAANPPETIDDLDSLAMPAWDMMDPRTYPDVVQGGFYEDFPAAPVVTSRGCPYECTFCANKLLMGRRVRPRSVANVADEIERLARDYGVKEIQIVDDNFTANRKRVLDFCGIIRGKGLKLHFAFPNGVRLDSLDREMLDALKGIGVYSITVGVESGSQRVLDHMKKRLKLESVREKVKLIKDSGFIVNAFFIIGYPAETRDDIEKTIRFARELPIDAAQFSSFLPLPGTEITERLISSGKIRRIEYSDLFYSRTPFAPEGMTTGELKALQRKAFLSFYLRPRALLGLIARIKSMRHLLSISARAADYIFTKKREGA